MIAWVLAGAVVLGNGHVVARGEEPAWSPQGKLAYMRDGAVHVGARSFRGVSPAWSRDGKRLAFMRPTNLGWDLWVARPNGKGAKRVAVNAQHPSWSRDGTIVFWRSPDGLQTDIWTVRADGTHARRLTSSRHDEAWPTVSPDGRTIAYTTDGALWTMRLDGSHKRRLHSTVGVDNWGPAWSPDGRTIAFVALQRGSKWVYTIRRDGSGLHRVAKGDDPTFRP